MGLAIALPLILLISVILPTPASWAPPAPNAVLTIEKHWVGATQPNSDIVVRDFKGTEIKRVATDDMPLCPGTVLGEGCARANIGVFAETSERKRDGPLRVTEEGAPSSVVASFSGDCDATGRVTPKPAARSTCVVTNVVADVLTAVHVNTVIGVRKTWEPVGSSYPDATITITDDHNHQIASFLASSMRKYDSGTDPCDAAARAVGPCEWLIGVNVPSLHGDPGAIRYSVTETGLPADWYASADGGCATRVLTGQLSMCSLTNVETLGAHGSHDNGILTIVRTVRGNSIAPDTIVISDLKHNVYRSFQTSQMRCADGVCIASVSTALPGRIKDAFSQLTVEEQSGGFVTPVFGGDCSPNGTVANNKPRMTCTIESVIPEYAPDGTNAVIAVSKRFIGEPYDAAFSLKDSRGHDIPDVPSTFTASAMHASDGSATPCLTFAVGGGRCEILIGVSTRTGKGALSYNVTETTNDLQTVVQRDKECVGTIEPGQVRECGFTNVSENTGVEHAPRAIITITKSRRGVAGPDRSIKVTDAHGTQITQFDVSTMDPCGPDLCMRVGVIPSPRDSSYRITESNDDPQFEQHVFGGDCVDGKVSAPIGSNRQCSITNVRDDDSTTRPNATIAITKKADGPVSADPFAGSVMQVIGPHKELLIAKNVDAMRVIGPFVSCEAALASGGMCEEVAGVIGNTPNRPQVYSYTVQEANPPAGWVVLYDNCKGAVSAGSIRECTITNVKVL